MSCVGLKKQPTFVDYVFIWCINVLFLEFLAILTSYLVSFCLWHLFRWFCGSCYEQIIDKYSFIRLIRCTRAQFSVACTKGVSLWMLFLWTAEVGNYCEDYVSQAYVSTLQLLPNQTPEIELQIIEHHREHMWVSLTLTRTQIDNCGPV